MFRVVPDQLRISDGWVRCGQCDEVFDANAHLQTLSTPVTALAISTPSPLTASRSDPVSELSSANTTQTSPVAAAYDWGDIVSSTTLPDVPVPVEQQHNPPEVPVAEIAVEPEAAAAQDQSVSDYQQEDDPFLSKSPHDLYVPGESMPEEVVPEETLATDTPLSFMPRVEKPSRRSRLLGAPLLLVMFALLTLGLGGQIVMLERNRLSAVFPAVRPALQVVCDVVGCAIAAPRQIEAIAIDSSSFNSIKPGVYILHVTLKNAAALALENPALELTLTDLQDQPLLRRVIQAGEYAGFQPVIAAGAELTLSVPVSVHTGAALEKIAGYKLLAFYP